MSQTLTSTLKFTITGSRTNAADLETASVSLATTIQHALTNGTGADQVDLLFSDTRTVATGANDDIDLAGVLTDAAFGNVLTFAKVKAIVIYNKLTANKQLTVGGDGSAGFTTWLGSSSDKIKIPPGGLFVLTDPTTGFAVTATTGDILRVTNASGGSTTYDIYIFGTSA